LRVGVEDDPWLLVAQVRNEHRMRLAHVLEEERPVGQRIEHAERNGAELSRDVHAGFSPLALTHDVHVRRDAPRVEGAEGLEK
jgi:hypothetical protein